MKTTHVKGADVESRWYLYDASEHVLGRMAAEIARRLQGKDRPTYTPSELSGDYVVVVNSRNAFLTGRKNTDKDYQHYTGYPGGRKVLDVDSVRERRPNDIVTLAVRRMLPKTRLGRNMLRRLKVYEGLEHDHSAQTPERVDADPLEFSLPSIPMVNNPYTWGLGRRKSAIARVRIKPGAGGFVVNGKPLNDFFPTLQTQVRANAPLRATESESTYDVFCNVNGGGPTGQSDAVRMGLARALKVINPGFEEVLRDEGLLTRDSRMKERKKYGRRGARRGFQFSKR